MIVTLVLGASGSVCQDEFSSDMVANGIFSKLKQLQPDNCISEGTCKIDSFTCFNNEALTFNFRLDQTAKFEERYPIYQTARQWEEIPPSLIAYQVTVSNRKREVVMITTRSMKNTVTTTCPDSTAELNGICTTCPPGHELYDTCKPCKLGNYGTGGFSACTQCSAGKTTLSIGSDDVTDCITELDFCTVKAEGPNALYIPPGGSRVLIDPDNLVQIICNPGYDIEHGTDRDFSCGDATYPSCYAKCDLTVYTEPDLATRKIRNLQLNGLSHNQKIKLTCRDGFKYQDDLSDKTIKCENGVLPDFGYCEELDNSTTTIIICATVLGIAAILLFLIFIVRWRKRKHAINRSDTGSPGSREHVLADQPFTDFLYSSFNTLRLSAVRFCSIDSVIGFVCSKAAIGNFITFSMMIISFSLYEEYSEKEDCEELVLMIRVFRTCGIYAFCCGLMNWVTFRLMFKKIPLIVGSGILSTRFPEIRRAVKKITMDIFFDAGHLNSYVVQKSDIIINSLQIEESFRKVLRDPAVHTKLSDKIDDMFFTPEGIFFCYLLKTENVKRGMLNAMENAAAEIVPLLSELIRSSEKWNEKRLRTQIEKLITTKLTEMKPEKTIAVLTNMLANELGWVVIWANVSGGFMGIFAQILLILLDD